MESAALLHDIDKAIPRRGQPHGEAGARWLAEHGYPELSEAVASHPVSRLGDDTRYAAFASSTSRETRIVAYADKCAAQRLEPMNRRFLRWERRHPELDASLARARERALALEREVCDAAGVAPEAVRRLRWVRAAMTRAERQQRRGEPGPVSHHRTSESATAGSGAAS